MRSRVSFPVRWKFRSVPVAPPGRVFSGEEEGEEEKETGKKNDEKEGTNEEGGG